MLCCIRCRAVLRTDQLPRHGCSPARKRNARRLLLAAALLAATAAPTQASASDLGDLTPTIPFPCVTYEDGSGLCGPAKWDGTTWVFDMTSRYTVAFCVHNEACDEAPES